MARTARPAADGAAPRGHRRPLRVPLVALLTLVALLLLATMLQALGVIGAGDGPAAGAAATVAGSPWTTIDEDGR